MKIEIMITVLIVQTVHNIVVNAKQKRGAYLSNKSSSPVPFSSNMISLQQMTSKY